ncbi:MAG: type I restriction-modification system subunit M N-terminal domain-containing protein [Pyrinomonadaceae bacterium]
MTTELNEIEKRLFSAADQLWANTGLRPSEYSAPVLGLIFLRYAERRFADAGRNLNTGGNRRTVRATAYQAQGVIYLPEAARFSHLLGLPEGENLGRAINDAMAAIEEENEELRATLPTRKSSFSPTSPASIAAKR